MTYYQATCGTNAYECSKGHEHEFFERSLFVTATVALYCWSLVGVRRWVYTTICGAHE